MTFESQNDYAVQDTVAYALDGLVSLLGGKDVMIDSRGLAAMIDMIRGHLNNLSFLRDDPACASHLRACRDRHANRKAGIKDLASIAVFKDEFIRATSMDNETVVEDVRDALNSLSLIFGEMQEKTISGQEVWALINVVHHRLDDFVIGKDLSEALADALPMSTPTETAVAA